MAVFPTISMGLSYDQPEGGYGMMVPLLSRLIVGPKVSFEGGIRRDNIGAYLSEEKGGIPEGEVRIWVWLSEKLARAVHTP